MTAPKPLNPSVSVPAFFGAEVRRLRLLADLTQDDLGSKILYTSSLVGLIESARRTPTRDFTERCDTTLSADGHLLRLWDLLTHARWPDAAKQAHDLEAASRAIRCYETTLIPRLLQTSDYARAVLATLGDRAACADLDSAVDTVSARQHVLTTATCWFAIDETVLHRRIGGVGIMRAQLERLARAADMPGVVVQVVPTEAREYPGLHGAVALLSPEGSLDVAYFEGHTTVLIDNPDTVARCSHAFDVIRATALSPVRSLAAIRSAIHHLPADAD